MLEYLLFKCTSVQKISNQPLKYVAESKYADAHLDEDLNNVSNVINKRQNIGF